MTDNARKIVNFMKENYGTDMTAQEIAKELGLTINAVTGTVNGLVKKDLGFRNEVTTNDSEGKAVTIKYVGLTEAGKDFDFDAEPEKKAKKAE